MSNETKVGVFVVISILAFLLISTLMGDISVFGGKKYTVIFKMTNADGLVPKSSVRYRGIDVGTVTAITLSGEDIMVQAKLDSIYKIPNNVTVILAQDGIMGSKFINLVAKSSEPSTGFIANNDIYDNSQPTYTIDELVAKLSEATSSITTFTNSLNEVFSSEEGKKNMADILSNMAQASKSLNNILESNEYKIGEIVNNVNNITEKLDLLFNQDNTDNITNIIGNINSFTAKLDNILNSSNSKNIDETIANISEISKDMRHMMAKLDQIVDNTSKGEGTVGMLLTDNDVKKQIKETISTLSNAMNKVNEIQFTLEGGADYNVSNDDYHGFFNLKIKPSNKRYYYLGVSTLPKYTKTKYTRYAINSEGYNKVYDESEEVTVKNTMGFTLQYALIYKENLFNIRGGLYESALGFGLDYHPFRDEKLTLTMDVSDFYRDIGTRLKFNMRYRFMEGFFVQTGWDNIGTKQNTFTIGAGVYFSDEDLKYVISSIPSLAK